MKHILAIAGLIAVSACADNGEVYRSYSEAGSLTDNGTFGDANMNNHLVMTREDGFAISLANRFAEEVPSTINFAFDSAALDADAQRILRQQADWIRQFPEVRFRVYGHTDLVGSAAYNKQLGLRRAQAAVAFLTSQGISRTRLEAVASFGATQPVVQTRDRERRNRRTVTEVSGFVKSNPIIMDGKYAEVVYREYVASAVPASTLIIVTDGTETSAQ
ncbi:MAG: hypothetical protein COW54_16500 [Rhodobacteraceae bacterium CG17_big_fil_post_rev_8_21_14_2_50_63_15]|nr:OmpA family protein [Roseovarius sp.]PIV77104.1 MAG: hypothetical protein COW54_16500 [Rhodobacteraceae bacterium CG17_big_fil_post_rev_8_21_14_2_50_63_15]